MRIRANGIDVRCEVSGSGPCVMFAHSLGSDLSIWDEQVSALAGSHTVLRYDLRGHGGTDAPDGPYDFGMLTADALGLLDMLGIERASFVGISLGGMIGQHLALAAPGRIERLALASTASRYPQAAGALFQERAESVLAHGLEPLVAPTLERWFTPSFHAAHPETVARIGGLIRATKPAGYAGCCLAIRGMNTKARLPEIRCPTLVIAGREDAGTPSIMGEEIARTIPGARFERIDGAAHLCNIEQAAAFNRLLVGFLE
ncbi:MAG: 3-oxoadipate enol-lactonase [Candidatus Nitricoxidivorans perseverans]|uniref:3-oxoadipate enol-lactonase n=1 Tax=Candidatus Nitricoxidivorans perseverans TaxID=2975601 RepID=A0AA49FI26_9PROT|nr:MAG: 3-oxoadipate enol-lactonase [Candidatus Nitricoxidivorans perseverans]